ncbi:MAG: DUF805 domain-containing protein [Bacteroides sp.]|nr:DUF805 domain-containing protein [Bacteroides sp.]MCM1456675.1 DUF805 domain-containing protein [Lachnoclostridium sp.]
MVQTPPPVGGTMGFQEAVRKVLNNYVNFQGRASRAEYWWWALFTFIIGVIFGALEVTGLKIFAILGGIVNLALLLPGLGVLWRRLHDMGRAGGWAFIALVPIVGAIILIYWLVQPSEQFTNRFGDVPVA